jgi:hypothetical protein
MPAPHPPCTPTTPPPHPPFTPATAPRPAGKRPGGTGSSFWTSVRPRARPARARTAPCVIWRRIRAQRAPPLGPSETRRRPPSARLSARRGGGAAGRGRQVAGVGVPCAARPPLQAIPLRPRPVRPPPQPPPPPSRAARLAEQMERAARGLRRQPREPHFALTDLGQPREPHFALRPRGRGRWKERRQLAVVGDLQDDGGLYTGPPPPRARLPLRSRAPSPLFSRG